MLNQGPWVHFARFTIIQNRPGPVKYGPPFSSALPCIMSHQKPLHPIPHPILPSSFPRAITMTNNDKTSKIFTAFVFTFSIHTLLSSSLSSFHPFSQSFSPPLKHFSLVLKLLTHLIAFTIFMIYCLQTNLQSFLKNTKNHKLFNSLNFIQFTFQLPFFTFAISFQVSLKPIST